MPGTRMEIPRKASPSRGGKISKKVYIKASPETVYKALTDAKDLVRWFCDRASCDPREGRELVATWGTGKSGRQGRAVFKRVVPLTALDLLWVDDGDGRQREDAGHTLAYEIRTKSGMTELAMTDKDDAPCDEETFKFIDEGWNSVLLELKDYCEHKERSSKVRAAAGTRPRKTGGE